MVAFECGWTGVMSVLTLAASIDVTISGPPAVCQSKAPFSVCASSTVLVPVSWLIGLLMLGYFLTLLGMSVGHMHTVANIWTSSIYSVPWFAEHDCTKPAAPQLPPIQTFFSPKRVSRRHSTSSFPQDVEAHPQGPSEKPLPAVRPADARSVESTRPWWAIQLRGRPGKDRPFTGVMKGKGKAREYNEPQDASGLRTPRSPDPDFHGRWLYHGEEEEVIAVYPKFQRSVLDPDKPIPLPKRGEWLPADSQGRL
ncbi:hypothetical protein BV25DRAFT_1693584 [Artomyces pyxidatus]|uniref:Uncharacterized protein n=1 Tax=Artomyces pyxidatus TaxID=48021 RepID=A0ACB8TAX8_9AGAM|nr:hypothetical protein BV25DRAFT_1693584 [Artomyces pyxidatus]